jgi:hypothetical protein
MENTPWRARCLVRSLSDHVTVLYRYTIYYRTKNKYQGIFPLRMVMPVAYLSRQLIVLTSMLSMHPTCASSCTLTCTVLQSEPPSEASLLKCFAGPGCACSSCIETFSLSRNSAIDDEAVRAEGCQWTILTQSAAFSWKRQ